MLDVEGSRNGEEGIEFEEDDDIEGGGDIVARLVDVTTNRNGADDGDAGLKLREKGPGSLFARLLRTRASNNSIGGILLREDLDGNLDGSLLDAIASHNGGAGVALEQEEPGTGEVRITRLRADDNTDGPVTTEGVIVIAP